MTPLSEDTDSDDERTVIRPGRDFEQEFRLSSSEAGEFLVELGEFAESEIEYEGVKERELEIELELPGLTEDRAPSVD